MLEDKLPPVNIEAEEAILGGILLDPEAMVRVADILVKEAFSIQSHQKIYYAAQTLHSQGKSTDLMSVSSYLADHSLLDEIGGTTKLAQLVNRTVSAVNIDRYANLVMNKYARRQLITSGHEIVDLGYDTTKDLEVVLDESEQKIFRLSQERPQQGLVAISDTLINAFNTIEELHQDTALPGIPSGFYDLDAVTSGFSRSDLIILAGRPSMGKCLGADSELVCQDGSIKTIEEVYENRQDSILTLQSNYKFNWIKPSAFIDDGIKPIYKLTTRLGRTVTTTLTHPFLTIKGWRSLEKLQVGDKIAVPRKIDVFGKNNIPEQKVKLLAYLIGDGCLTKTCPEFINSNPLLQDDFTWAISIFPGIIAKKYNSNGTRTTSIRIAKDNNFVKENRHNCAKKLKATIKDRDKTSNQIAKSLKVSPSLISLWLQGSCVPNEKTFMSLCSLLKIEIQDIAPYGISAISKNRPNTLTLWLQELGLWGKDAHNKTIPSVIFTLKSNLIALFLNRLFATDGWATVLKSGQSQLGYATVSDKLARQIQHLLLRFGVIASLKHRSVKYENKSRRIWQLDITDAKSIKNFIDKIGIFGKEEAINKVREAIFQKRYQTNRDLIPVEVWQELKQAKGNESWTALAKRSGIKGYTNLHVNKRALSRERLFQLAYSLENINLQNLAASEIYWDEIVSIEAIGKEQVYDLTIPETHNFVANDICVHNTALALNIANNIAQKERLPIAIFSLEMSREQLAQRLLASESKIASNRLRSGRISQNEIESLVNGVGNLSELPIYIDDTANLSVMQMRSQVRRLQGQLKSELGLVLLDYLQLMEGSGSDNRVQELSKITRSLKGLAREVNVPIIALSQLSRGVEQRNNKRPMLSDLRESGCLSGDTLVTLDNGLQVPIRELAGSSGFKIFSLNTNSQQIESATVTNAFCTGIKPVFHLTTSLGRTIDATTNHKFFTINGWKRLDDLEIGETIALPRCINTDNQQTISNEELALGLYKQQELKTISEYIASYVANTNRDIIPKDVWKLYAVTAMQENGITTRQMQASLGISYCGTSIYKQNISRDRAMKLANAVKSEAIVNLANSDIYWDKVVSIEYLKETDVYDLTVPKHHNFVANNIIVHNSIEQDADLVIMLYRDEYYNPDTPDRGLAEAIIVKHRNGPVGTVKLIFQGEFTKFDNLARPSNY